MQSDKKQILNRLATIEGHVKGIRKMVEEDQYCVDIVKQSYAVERALKAFESALLEGHLIGGDLRNIVTAIALSRKTVGVIKQGLFWAFAYNIVPSWAGRVPCTC